MVGTPVMHQQGVETFVLTASVAREGVVVSTFGANLGFNLLQNSTAIGSFTGISGSSGQCVIVIDLSSDLVDADGIHCTGPSIPISAGDFANDRLTAVASYAYSTHVGPAESTSVIVAS